MGRVRVAAAPALAALSGGASAARSSRPPAGGAARGGHAPPVPAGLRPTGPPPRDPRAAVALRRPADSRRRPVGPVLPPGWVGAGGSTARFLAFPEAGRCAGTCRRTRVPGRQRDRSSLRTSWTEKGKAARASERRAGAGAATHAELLSRARVPARRSPPTAGGQRSRRRLGASPGGARGAGPSDRRLRAGPAPCPDAARPGSRGSRKVGITWGGKGEKTRKGRIRDKALRAERTTRWRTPRRPVEGKGMCRHAAENAVVRLRF